MPLKAVANALLVPPISLLVVALLGSLIERGYGRIGRFLRWAGLLSLLVLALPVTSGVLMIALERDLPLTPPPGSPPQAIVILGGDVVQNDEESLVLHLGQVSLERVRAGAALSRRTGLPILVSGGSVRDDEPAVAATMADSLMRDFQVPARWSEDASHDTWENARLSAAILRGQGIGSVYVVTNAWHMRRALMAFADTGITATAAPPRMDQLLTPFGANYVPVSGAWQESYLALHEWIGCAYYALRR
jgi:uncharacterized SAM-binding protein YcdF (DUF218 family)